MMDTIKTGVDTFKALNDLIKTLGNMADASEREKAIHELQSRLMSANTAYFSIIDSYREIEEKLKKMETWSDEAARYELYEFPPGILLRRVKEGMRGTQPVHYICADCYNNNRKSLLHVLWRNGNRTRYVCNQCKSEFTAGEEQPLTRQESYGSWMAE